MVALTSLDSGCPRGVGTDDDAGVTARSFTGGSACGLFSGRLRLSVVSLFIILVKVDDFELAAVKRGRVGPIRFRPHASWFEATKSPSQKIVEQQSCGVADDAAFEHHSNEAGENRDGSAERRDFAECEKGKDHEAVFEDSFHSVSGDDWHGIRSLFDCVSIKEESSFTDFSGSVAALAPHFSGSVATRTALLSTPTSAVAFRAVLPSSGVSPEVCEAVRTGSRFHFRSSICLCDHRLPVQSHLPQNFPALAVFFISCSNSPGT